MSWGVRVGDIVNDDCNPTGATLKFPAFSWGGGGGGGGSSPVQIAKIATNHRGTIEKIGNVSRAIRENVAVSCAFRSCCRQLQKLTIFATGGNVVLFGIYSSKKNQMNKKNVMPPYSNSS